MILIRLHKTSLLKCNAINSLLPLYQLQINKSQTFFSTSKKLFGNKYQPNTSTKSQQNTIHQQEKIIKTSTQQQQQNIKTKPKWAHKINGPKSQIKNTKKQQDFEDKKLVDNIVKKKKSSFLSTSKQSNSDQSQQTSNQFQQPFYQKKQSKSFNKLSSFMRQSKKQSTFQQQPYTSLEKQNSSYNFRSCQMILYQFKDIAKQSKNVRSLIASFNQFTIKLRDQNVQQTQLRENYKAIMYSGVMRTFARILRRESNPDRSVMIQFLGENYENILSIRLQQLRTLQISDFVSFFFLFELLGRYRSISISKLSVVQRYLETLYKRYKDNKNMLLIRQNEKQLVDSEQKMDKRYLSEIIIGARCAELFNSPLYGQYLQLIIQHLNQKQLVPYKMVSILKFIMREQQQNMRTNNENNVSRCRQKQLVLLQVIVNSVQSSIKDMDVMTLREFYGNLLAITGNNEELFISRNSKTDNIDSDNDNDNDNDKLDIDNDSYSYSDNNFNNNSNSNILDMNTMKKVINNIQQTIINRITEFPPQQIYHIASYSINTKPSSYNDTNPYKLAKYIYYSILQSLNQQGQTSMNPLFIIMLVSNLNSKIVRIFGFDNVDWEGKILKMVKRYLIVDKNDKTRGQSQLSGLAIYSEYVNKLIRNLHPQSDLYYLLIQSIITNTLIIPYDNQSLLIQNHYLTHQSQNKQMVFATLYRLQHSIVGNNNNSDKNSKLFVKIFNQLQQSINLSQQQKTLIKQKHYEYINSSKQIKKNKLTYIRTLAKLCSVLKKQHLISQLFYQSLVQIINFSKQHHKQQLRRDNKEINNREQITAASNSNSNNDDIVLDMKSRQKAYSLILNYMTVIIQLKLTIITTNALSNNNLKQDKFIQSIKANPQLVKIYLQLLSSKDVKKLLIIQQDVEEQFKSLNILGYYLLQQ